MKSCTVCKEVKPTTEFYKASRGIEGFAAHCKSCNSLKVIRFMYGIQPADYLKMLESGCNICGSHRFLQIDHDHSCCPGRKTCGKCIRGVLCKRHNVLLGLLRDSPEEIRAAEEYLAKHS